MQVSSWDIPRSPTSAFAPGSGRSRFHATARIGAAVLSALGLTVASMVSGSLPIAGAAVAGDLDPTFSTDGKVVTPTTGVGMAVVKQPDGKLVVVGGTDDAGIAPAGVSQVIRYNTDGTLDSTFAAGGILTSGTGSAAAVALQANLKIVIAGTSGADVAVSRINDNGSLDSAFGNAGQVLLNLTFGSFTIASATGVAVDSNGKIVVVGTIVNSSELDDFLVIRFNTNGTLDATFNSAGLVPGVVTTSVQSQEQDFAAGVAIQADNRIVVSGSTKSGQFALVRYTTTGALDATFGNGGIVLANPKVAEGAAVTVQPDGKLVVVGSQSVTNAASTNCIDSLGHFCEYSDLYIARYLSTGQLDPAFGVAGARTVAINPRGNDDFAAGVALQADGKVIVVGLTERSIHTYSNGGNDESFSREHRLRRRPADG